MAQILPFTRKSSTPAVRISPLTAFDGTEAVRILAARFAIRPADEKFALHRVLSLVIVSTDGQRVRALRGTLYRRATGGGVTLTDADGFVLGRNLNFSQILAWSTCSSDQMEASTVKTLRGIQSDIDAAFAASFAASMAELNTDRRSARQLIAA